MNWSIPGLSDSMTGCTPVEPLKFSKSVKPSISENFAWSMTMKPPSKPWLRASSMISAVGCEGPPTNSTSGSSERAWLTGLA
jgi:hypothetical protein